jgi:hypothetical protein
MALQTSTGIPAASGYPQYSGSLIHPMFGQDLIEQFYCSTVFGDISVTDFIGDLQSCGDQITFWREPQVIIRDHIKDGTIKHDTLEAKPIQLSIDKAKEFSIKMAKVDEKQMCNWDTFRASMLNSASRRSADEIDCDILGTVYADADRANRGTSAGILSGCYNLGEVGAPLQITRDNILDVLISIGAVFDEQCVPMQDRWIVVPPKFKQLVLSSDLRMADFSGLNESTQLNGMMPAMVAGFKIYVSNHVSMVIDSGTNQMAWNIIAGWKGSVVFASQLDETRIIEDKDSWDRYYQGLLVYGFGVIQPTGLAHLYATFA